MGFAQRWSTNVGTINVNIVPVGESLHLRQQTMSIRPMTTSFLNEMHSTHHTGTAGTTKIDPYKGTAKLDLSIWYVSVSNNLVITFNY